jgi:site-specific recombinase XerD
LLRAVRKGNQTSRAGKGSKDEVGDQRSDIEDGGANGNGNGNGDVGDEGISGAVRDMAVIQTLLGTGLRISELANLRLEDVELSNRKGMVRVREGKGGKSRIVPLDNRTRSALLRYVGTRQKQLQLLEQTSEHMPGRLPSTRRSRSRKPDSRQFEGPLFVGQRGPLNERGIDYLVRKYAYQARLENCTAHTLRHTFAKNLVDAGTPLDQVAILLGHESLDTTRVYTRPSRRDLERAVRKAAGEIAE